MGLSKVYPAKRHTGDAVSNSYQGINWEASKDRTAGTLWRLVWLPLLPQVFRHTPSLTQRDIFPTVCALCVHVKNGIEVWFQSRLRAGTTEGWWPSRLIGPKEACSPAQLSTRISHPFSGAASSADRLASGRYASLICGRIPPLSILYRRYCLF